MKELDYFNPNKDNYFNIFTFTLNLNFSIEKMDLNTYSLFVHEYTHYIQSIGTINGIALLFKYFSFVKNVYLDINDKICDDQEYELDYLTKYSSQYDEIKNLYNYTITKKNTNNWPDLFLSYEKFFHPIFKKEVIEYFITLGDEDYHISQKCLRETMAMMTFFHARNYSINQAVNYLNQDTIKPIYKILFLYFVNKYPYIDDHFIFLYYFCEIALQTDSPNEILDKLFQTIRYQPKNSRIKTEVFLSRFQRENPQFFTRLGFLVEKFKKEIVKLNLLGINNEYFTAAHEYLKRCIIALNEYLKKLTFINSFTNIETLKELSKKILSPIIIQNFCNQIKVSTLDDQTNKYELALVFGVSQLLEGYINIKDGITPSHKKCIFFDDIPICQFAKSLTHADFDINICLRKPFYIKPFHDGNCIFYNSSLVIGMLPDEEINKYKKTTRKYVKN